MMYNYREILRLRGGVWSVWQTKRAKLEQIYMHVWNVSYPFLFLRQHYLDQVTGIISAESITL